MYHVLIVEDEEVLGRNISRFLEMEQWAVTWETEGSAGIRAFQTARPDVVLLDLNLPDIHGMDVLRSLRSQDGAVPVIIFTAYGSIQSVVEAMKRGATDYLTKPVDLQTLHHALNRASREYRMSKQLSYYRRSWLLKEKHPFLGSSAASASMKQRVKKIAALLESEGINQNVLIHGRTGSGKTFLARHLHRASSLAEQPLVEVYCPNMSRWEARDELFGSSGDDPMVGLVEMAEGGTLLLDGVDTLPVDVQTSLVPLLKERSYRRRGSTRMRTASLMVIGTTDQRPVPGEEGGSFHPSFYEALAGLDFPVADLSARGSDVLEILDHFSSHFALKYHKPAKEFSGRAQTFFLDYPWPGNILELKNLVERLYLLSDSEMLDIDEIRGHMNREVAVQQITLSPDGIDLPGIEKQLIERALAMTRYNAKEAACLLNLTPTQLTTRMRSLSIQGSRPSGGVE